MQPAASLACTPPWQRVQQRTRARRAHTPAPPHNPITIHNRFELLEASSMSTQPDQDGMAVMNATLATLLAEQRESRAEQQRMAGIITSLHAHAQSNEAGLQEVLHHIKQHDAELRDVHQHQRQQDAVVHQLEHHMRLCNKALEQKQQQAHHSLGWKQQTLTNTHEQERVSTRLFVRTDNAPPQHATKDAVAARLNTQPTAVHNTRNPKAYVVDMGDRAAAAAAVREHRRVADAGGDTGGLVIKHEKTLLGQRRAACMVPVERAIEQALSTGAFGVGWRHFRAPDSSGLLLTNGTLTAAQKGTALTVQYPVWQHLPYSDTANRGMGGFVLEPKSVCALERVPGTLRELLGMHSTSTPPPAPTTAATPAVAAAAGPGSGAAPMDADPANSKRSAERSSAQSAAPSPAKKRQEQEVSLPPTQTVPPPLPAAPTPPPPSPPPPPLETAPSTAPSTRSSSPNSSRAPAHTCAAPYHAALTNALPAAAPPAAAPTHSRERSSRAASPRNSTAAPSSQHVERRAHGRCAPAEERGRLHAPAEDRGSGGNTNTNGAVQ